MTGGGGGGGGGARWASAVVDANAMVSAKAIAASPCPSLEPLPVFLDCKGVAERRINIIPRKSAARA
jgi:hypothetical protein